MRNLTEDVANSEIIEAAEEVLVEVVEQAWTTNCIAESNQEIQKLAPLIVGFLLRLQDYHLILVTPFTCRTVLALPLVGSDNAAKGSISDHVYSTIIPYCVPE